MTEIFPGKFGPFWLGIAPVFPDQNKKTVAFKATGTRKRPSLPGKTPVYQDMVEMPTPAPPQTTQTTPATKTQLTTQSLTNNRRQRQQK